MKLTKKSKASINGCVAIDANVDQFLSLKLYEKKFGRLSYLGQWNGWEIYVPYGSAAAVAHETATITFNQTLIDLGMGRKS